MCDCICIYSFRCHAAVVHRQRAAAHALWCGFPVISNITQNTISTREVLNTHRFKDTKVMQIQRRFSAECDRGFEQRAGGTVQMPALHEPGCSSARPLAANLRRGLGRGVSWRGVLRRRPGRGPRRRGVAAAPPARRRNDTQRSAVASTSPFRAAGSSRRRRRRSGARARPAAASAASRHSGRSVLGDERAAAAEAHADDTVSRRLC